MDQSIAAVKAEIALEAARLEALYPQEQQVLVGTERDSALRKRYDRVCGLRRELNTRINAYVQKYGEPYAPNNQQGERCVYAAALPFGTTLPDADAVHAGTLWVMPYVRLDCAEPGGLDTIMNTGLKYYIVPLVNDWVENARFITQMPTYHWKCLPARLFAVEETPDEQRFPSAFPQGPDNDLHTVNAFVDEHEQHLLSMRATLEVVDHYEPDT